MCFLYLSIVVVAITVTAFIAKLASLRQVTPLDLATSLFTVKGLI
jgi:hypothetical protein